MQSCRRTNEKLPLQLSNQDEVGRGARQRGGASDAGCIRDTDQESFPHLQLILGLQLDLLRCHHVTLLHLIRPVVVLRNIIPLNECFMSPQQTSQRAAHEHTTQTTADDQIAHPFCACMSSNKSQVSITVTALTDSTHSVQIKAN